VSELLAVASDVVDEMLATADDFRYAANPRLDLFEACMRAYHTHIYAQLATLFVDTSRLSPMAALHTIAWLQEYRERLATAGSPPLQPPLDEAQTELVGAYAGQARATWEQCIDRLHAADAIKMARGEIDGGSGGKPATMAPVDLLTLLNAPFATLNARLRAGCA